MNVLRICKNNFLRATKRKEIFVLSFILIPALIALLFFILNKPASPKPIAFVTSSDVEMPKIENVDIEKINEEPNYSDLILKKYSAIVKQNDDGSFNIKTILSKDFKNFLDSYLNNKGDINLNDYKDNKRGTGTNCIGFISVFILSLSFFLMDLCNEDKSCGAFRRILTSRTSARGYLSAQCLFNFLLLFIPSCLTVLVLHGIFDVNIGLPLTSFIFILFLLCALSSMLSLALSSLIDDPVSYLSSSLSLGILLLLFSGALIPFNNDNGLFDTVTNVLPFKTLLTLSQNVENGNSIFMYNGMLIYIVLFIVCLYFIGTAITKKKSSFGTY